MKIDPKSKTVRVTLTKGEFATLGELLRYASREAQANPVMWTIQPKKTRDMLTQLLAVVHGMSGYSVSSVDDATKLDPLYRETVLRLHPDAASSYAETRKFHQEHLERQLSLGPGGLDGDL